jgi:hypothetical protein
LLRRAVEHVAGYGITVERLITDNGKPYRSTVRAIACGALRIRHIRGRPYRPRGGCLTPHKSNSSDTRRLDVG